MADNEIMIVDERNLKDKVYNIRGTLVMLDFELAELYGYTTKAFNQQVKNNIKKFDADFRFKLSKEEWSNLKSKILTPSWGGRRTIPYAFTEQGIYMLMTVLRGDLAIKQSKKLIRMFKHMKDYIYDNPVLFRSSDLLELSAETKDNTLSIQRIEENMLTKADLPEFMKLFDQGLQNEEILILDGQPFKADMAYQKIYRSAKKSIVVIDDYLGVKTLQHLVHAKDNVKLTIISDNKLKLLKLSEYNDFLAEYPKKTVDFIKSENRAHDRYIIIDNGTTTMKVYHCGASSKDAGKRITSIMRVKDISNYKEMIKDLLTNPPLALK